jgi:hypothetical protein
VKELPRVGGVSPEKQKGREPCGPLPFLILRRKNYFFFFAAFLGAFLAVFFLVAMENHPLYRSHLEREIVQIKFDHCITIKFFVTHRQMESHQNEK